MGHHLAIQRVCKQFDGQKVLECVDLSVHKGEFFFLLGPSGCGKTTLLRIIAGLLEADSGHIFLDSKEITSLPAYKRDVNTVFQNYALFPHMTVFENIAFGLRMKHIPDTVIKNKIFDMLHLVKLEGYEQKKPATLSGGQAQRVALARALINEPAVLLLDEPLGALDVKLRKHMQSELKQLQKKIGTTFVCVTHDQEEALAMGDRIAVMNSGVIEQVGTPHDLYHKPYNQFVCDFLGACNFIRIESKRVGIRPERIAISKENLDITPDFSSHKARIIESVFTGNMQLFVAEKENGTLVQVAKQNTPDTTHLRVGDAVYIGWSKNDIITFHGD